MKIVPTFLAAATIAVVEDGVSGGHGTGSGGTSGWKGGTER
jgi:hypothetical protein